MAEGAVVGAAVTLVGEGHMSACLRAPGDVAAAMDASPPGAPPAGPDPASPNPASPDQATDDQPASADQAGADPAGDRRDPAGPGAQPPAAGAVHEVVKTFPVPAAP